MKWLGKGFILALMLLLATVTMAPTVPPTSVAFSDPAIQVPDPVAVLTLNANVITNGVPEDEENAFVESWWSEVITSIPNQVDRPELSIEFTDDTSNTTDVRFPEEGRYLVLFNMRTGIEDPVNPADREAFVHVVAQRIIVVAPAEDRPVDEDPFMGWLSPIFHIQQIGPDGSDVITIYAGDGLDGGEAP